MSRIFSALALFAVLLLMANIGLGFYLGDMGRSSEQYEEARREAHELESKASASSGEVVAAQAEKDRRLDMLGDMRRNFQPHVWLGIIAALVTVLVNCISVTYFIGTSRWCHEVVEAYDLDVSLAQRSRALKRRSFPYAFLGIMTTIGMVALGAASDPGASLASPASWVVPHMIAAFAGTAVIAYSFCVQAAAIDANFVVIRQILAEAERIRSVVDEADRTAVPVAQL